MGGPTSVLAEYRVAVSAATVGAKTWAGVVTGGPGPVVVRLPVTSVTESATAYDVAAVSPVNLATCSVESMGLSTRLPLVSTSRSCRPAKLDAGRAYTSVNV